MGKAEKQPNFTLQSFQKAKKLVTQFLAKKAKEGWL